MLLYFSSKGDCETSILLFFFLNELLFDSECSVGFQLLNQMFSVILQPCILNNDYVALKCVGLYL